MLLHRFTVKPHHLDAYLELWPEEVALRRLAGFRIHPAFVEVDAEPRFTWLYSHPEGAAGNAALAADPRYLDLRARMEGHVFGHVKIRPVDVEIKTELSDPAQPGAQRPYYQDAARIELRGVCDYMADHDIHPARQLGLPA